MLFSLLRVKIFGWLTVSGPLALFGIYYGILTTLPLGLSQLVSIRACLLENEEQKLLLFKKTETKSLNKVFAASITGLLVGQIAIYLSAYYPPLYTIWVKPHALALLVFPYTLYYWYRIREYNPSISLSNFNSNINPKVTEAFLDSLFFQVFNPILFPSPVLARLMHLFMFRYSHIPTFLLGGLLGWIGGQVIFIQITHLLLARLKYDAPKVYVLTKRLIHHFFPPVVFAICLTYLGGAPMAIFKKTPLRHWDTNSWSWPDSVFDHRIARRPIRFVEFEQYKRLKDEYEDKVKNVEGSNKETNKEKQSQKKSISLVPFNKKHFSQYFFQACKSDGKQRLSHTYPKSFSFVLNQLDKFLDLPQISEKTEKQIYKEWVNKKANRRNWLDQTIRLRLLNQLDQPLLLDKIIEKKVASLSIDEENIRKISDPRLGQGIRIQTYILEDISPWLSLRQNTPDETIKDFVPTLSNPTNAINRVVQNGSQNNKLINWISDKWKDSNNYLVYPQKIYSKKIELSWEKLIYAAQIAMKNEQKRGETIHLSEETQNNVKKNSSERVNSNRQFEIQLGIKKWFKNRLNINNYSSIVQDSIIPIDTNIDLINLYKPVAKWNPNISCDPDAEWGKHMGDWSQNLTNNNDCRPKRKANRPNNTDPILKGSVRARRRKGVVWELFQPSLRAILLLRSEQAPVSFAEESDYDFSNLTEAEYSKVQNQKAKLMWAQQASDRAVNYNSMFIHVIRGPALIIQAFLRKYIQLPLYIFAKNYGRLILRHSSELTQDWAEWAKEGYLICNYDGKVDLSQTKEVSNKQFLFLCKMPEKWFTEGLQIRILRTFYIKPWHENSNPNENYEESLENALHHNFLQDAPYLNMWGQHTELPFGKIRQKPAFWKPIFKALKFYVDRKIFKNATLNLDQEVNKQDSKEIIPLDSSEVLTVKDTDFQSDEEDYFVNDLQNQLSNQVNVDQSSVIPDMDRDKFAVADNSITGQKTKNINLYDIGHIDEEGEFDVINDWSLTNLKNQLFIRQLHKEEFFFIKNETLFKPNQVRLISKAAHKSFRYRRTQLQITLIQINTSWSKLIKQNIWLTSYLGKNLIQYIKHINRNIIDNVNYLFNLSNKQKIKFYRILFDICHNLFYSSTMWISNIFISSKSDIESTIRAPKNKLSQAYILHKLWQAGKWDQFDFNDNILIQDRIYKSNILSLLQKDPIILTYENWEANLSVFKRFTSPSAILDKIAPQNWREEVTREWKNSQFNQIDELATNTYTLPYHTALCNQVEKWSKITRLKLLFDRSIYPLNYRNKKQLEAFESKEYSKICIDHIVNSHINENEEISDIVLDSIASLVNNFEDDSELERVMEYAQLEVTENTNNNDDDDDDIELPFILHLTPGIFEKYRSRKHQFRLKTLDDLYMYYKFFSQTDGLIPDFLNEALDHVYKNGMEKNINVIEYTPKILDDIILVDTITSSLLRFYNRSAEGVSLGLWKYSPANSLLEKGTFSNSMLTPEEILLPQTLREFRVLSTLNLEVDGDKYEQLSAVKLNNTNFAQIQSINKNNYNIFATEGLIKRFIWPSYMLEDLACINRLWMGTANNSRFSALRFQLYPSFNN